jgi:Zn-dependent peptidase ImmA (M78 family)/DNA-binding XRE family transcriptional regulator
MIHFAERLKSARVMAGYSLQDLAEKIGDLVSKQALGKYEQGIMKPNSEVLLALCKALNVKTDYFSREPKVNLQDIEFRKLQKLSARENSKIVQQTIDFLERYLELEEILGIQNKFSNAFSRLPIEDNKGVEKLVHDLRYDWKLGTDPLFNIMELLEDHGIKVMEVDAPIEFSGMSTWVNDEVPVIVINSKLDEFLDRKRFTALHELGHLMMPQIKSFDLKQKESFCNYFAGAMLMPEELFRKELGGNRKKILFNELAAIKKQYGISYKAVIYRAKNLGVISESYCKQFMFMMSSMGYRINEPVQYVGYEKSNRFSQLLSRALAEEIISMSKAAALNNQKLADFRDTIF